MFLAAGEQPGSRSWESVGSDRTIVAGSEEFLNRGLPPSYNSLRVDEAEEPITAVTQDFVNTGRPPFSRSMNDVDSDRTGRADSQEFVSAGRPLKGRSLEEGIDRHAMAVSQDFLNVGKSPKSRSMGDVGMDRQIRAVSQDYLSAGKPSRVRSAIHVGMDNRRGSGQGLDAEDNATLAGSTDTLISRFADGDVENVLRDVQDIASSDSGSRLGSSYEGSVPNLFARPDARVTSSQSYGEPGAPGGYPQDAVSDLRQRFRVSDSDSSRSYDQLMEAPLIEEEERISRILQSKDDEMRVLLSRQGEEYDQFYQGRVREMEAACMQMDEYIHKLNDQHRVEMDALKNKSLKLAEENIKDVRQEHEKEKAMIHKKDEEKLSALKLELVGKQEKLIEKFVKQQDGQMDGMRDGTSFYLLSLFIYSSNSTEFLHHLILKIPLKKSSPKIGTSPYHQSIKPGSHQ